MDWETLVAEFRDLGGVAENVRLGTGVLGRGIFAVDPTQPVKLRVPERLLVPIEDVEIRDGRMVVKAESALGSREREFFDDYQQCFGWGAGLFDDIWESQKAWSDLPAGVVDALKSVGGSSDHDRRFLAPAIDLCFELYAETRCVSYEEKLHVAPVVELVNHSSVANGWVVDGGIGVQGRFGDEVLVRYNLGDAWGHALLSGFAHTSLFAHSIALAANVGERCRLSIGRAYGKAVIHDGIVFPQARSEGGALRLPFLTLGFSGAPDLPRAVFRKVASPHLSVSQADDVFESIAHFNRRAFIDLLRTLRKYDGPLVAMLQEAAIDQLETLSYSVGARNLDLSS